MPKLIVYRYDDECYTEGQVIRPRGDSFNTLTDQQKVVERAIRSTLHDGTEIRGNSVYTWVEEGVARRLWPLSKKKHLYELEIEHSNIRFQGDLNCYSTAIDAVAAGRSPQNAVEKYCRGEEAGPPYTEPRIEVLVSEAKVIRKL
jgi:hypothetical protein